MEKKDNRPKLIEGYHWTEYKELPNIPINDKYSCSELEGIFNMEGKTPVKVCPAISIIKQSYDKTKDVEYIELIFFNDNKEDYESVIVQSSDLGEKETIKKLKNHGFTIYNKTSWEWFINSLVDGIKIHNRKFQKDDENFEIIQKSNSSSQFGFVKNSFGEWDFTKFYTKHDTISTEVSKNIDGPLFEQKGTLEGEIEFYKQLHDECTQPHIVKLQLAITLAGVLLPFCSNVANPVVLFPSPSTTGKGFLTSMINPTPWGKPGEEGMNGNGILRSAKDTDAYWWLLVNRLNNLLADITEIQPILDDPKKGIKFIRDLIYSHVDGTNGGRCNVDGTARDNIRECRNILQILCEQDVSEQLNNGADSRVLTLNSGLRSETDYFVKDTSKFGRMSKKNYGNLGPAFVEKVIAYAADENNDIYSDVSELINDFNKLVAKNKKANALALLLYTYNQSVEFKLVPSDWKKMTPEEFIKFFIIENESKETTDKVIDIFVERILRDPGFPDKGLVLNQNQYDELAKSERAVRGRTERKNGYLYIYINKANLELQFDDITKSYGITDFKFSIKTLENKGHVLRAESGRLIHQYTDITGTYKKVGQERIYVLRFKMDENEEDARISDSLSNITNILDNDLIPEFAYEKEPTPEEKEEEQKRRTTEDYVKSINEMMMFGQYQELLKGYDEQEEDFETYKQQYLDDICFISGKSVIEPEQFGADEVVDALVDSPKIRNYLSIVLNEKTKEYKNTKQA